MLLWRTSSSPAPGNMSSSSSWLTSPWPSAESASTFNDPGTAGKPVTNHPPQAAPGDDRATRHPLAGVDVRLGDAAEPVVATQRNHGKQVSGATRGDGGSTPDALAGIDVFLGEYVYVEGAFVKIFGHRSAVSSVA